MRDGLARQFEGGHGGQLVVGVVWVVRAVVIPGKATKGPCAGNARDHDQQNLQHFSFLPAHSPLLNTGLLDC